MAEIRFIEDHSFAERFDVVQDLMLYRICVSAMFMTSNSPS